MDSDFNRSSFISFLLDNRVVGFFEKPITLKSGRKSHWYCNWRTVSNDAFLMDQLSDFLIEYVEDAGLEPDVFFGVAEGATKLGVLSTFKWAKGMKGFSKGSHSLPMGRGKPKEHGDPKDRYFVGEPRGRVVVVEDVTTTGGSLITALKGLAEAGCANVVAAIGLTNRQELRDDGTSVADAISKMGVRYLALSSAEEFLPKAIERFKPAKEIVASLAAEFRQYGVDQKFADLLEAKC